MGFPSRGDISQQGPGCCRGGSGKPPKNCTLGLQGLLGCPEQFYIPTLLSPLENYVKPEGQLQGLEGEGDPPPQSPLHHRDLPGTSVSFRCPRRGWRGEDLGAVSALWEHLEPCMPEPASIETGALAPGPQQGMLFMELGLFVPKPEPGG